MAASNVSSRQNYVPTNTNVAPQIAALQASGAQVVVSYTIPAFTALALLTAAKLNYHPTWVVSNVGSDVPTLTGLLTTFSKGAVGAQLLTGMVTDIYEPPVSDAVLQDITNQLQALQTWQPPSAWMGPYWADIQTALQPLLLPLVAV